MVAGPDSENQPCVSPCRPTSRQRGENRKPSRSSPAAVTDEREDSRRNEVPGPTERSRYEHKPKNNTKYRIVKEREAGEAGDGDKGSTVYQLAQVCRRCRPRDVPSGPEEKRRIQQRSGRPCRGGAFDSRNVESDDDPTTYGVSSIKWNFAGRSGRPCACKNANGTTAILFSHIPKSRISPTGAELDAILSPTQTRRNGSSATAPTTVRRVMTATNARSDSRLTSAASFESSIEKRGNIVRARLLDRICARATSTSG